MDLQPRVGTHSRLQPSETVQRQLVTVRVRGRARARGRVRVRVRVRAS